MDMPDLERRAEALWLEQAHAPIENHPSWAKTEVSSKGGSIRLVGNSQAGSLKSFALFHNEPGALLWTLGDVRLFRKRIQRVHVTSSEVCAASLDDPQKREHAASLIQKLADEANGRPVFVQALPVGSALHQVICNNPVPFWVLKHGAQRAHSVIDFPDSVDAFHRSLGQETRRSARRDFRNLEKHTGGDVALVSFSSPSQIAEFLDKAIPVSRETYQYRLLGLGLQNRDNLTRLFGSMAERGWWRGYVLLCKGEPTWFSYGYHVGGAFYYWEMGYRPDWQNWSVGKIGTMKLIEQLIGQADGPKRFDFQYGDLQFKRLLANRSWDEQDFYLFPKTAANFAMVRSLALTNAVSASAGRVLDRYKLKAKVRNLLRLRR